MSMSAEASAPDVFIAGLPEREPERAPERRLRALSAPARAKRPTLAYGIAAVAGALAIGAAQMGLSILTTQTSYEIADLTSQQRQLSWDKQILEDDVAGLGSPQYLAANAAALGMVTGQTPSYLRLSDGAIIGAGSAASAATSVSALRDAAVGNALVSGVPLVTDASSSLESGASVDETLLRNTPTPPPISDGLPTPDTH